MPRTRSLEPTEARVIGALLEKEQTTPEYYPLTLKALVAACNQKSNREPVMRLSAEEVSDVLESLRQDVLVWRSEGARSVRWQHSVDRRWQLDGAGKAIMTLLLLRGPQTAGELRTRSERMHAFASVEDVEAKLQDMQNGFDALVRELPRQPGQRENRWMHLMGTEDPEEVATAMAAADTPAAAPRPRHDAALAARVEHLEVAIEELRGELQTLRQRLGDD